MYGVLAEFTSPEALIAATQAARASKFTRIEAYTPFPVPELAATLHAPRSRVALVTLIGGVVGAVGGFFLQWYTAAIDYPINVGGRPLFSWPAFIPITFELTILGASLAAVFGMLALNGLPRLHHPLFQIHEFELASRNRFFLCIRASDPRFDAQRTEAFVQSLQPRATWTVP